MSTSSSDAGTRAERLRVLTLGRLVAAGLLTATLATVARDTVDPAGWPLLLTAGAIHLAVQTVIVLARPVAGPLVRVTAEFALIVDVAVLGIVVALTGGPASPLSVVLLVEVVAVTLLFGRWAGIRVAILASLAALWALMAGPPAVQLALDALAGPDPALAAALDPPTRTGFLLAGLWAATLLTGWLSDVTERDLRRRTEDLTMLRDLTPDLDPRRGHEQVGQALADAVVHRVGHPAATVWLPDADLDGGFRLAAEQGTRAHPSMIAADRVLWADDDLVEHVNGSDPLRAIRRDDPRPQALEVLFGRRAPLVAIGLRVDGRTVGLLIVEVGARFGRGPSLRVRDVEVLRMLAEQAALLVDNARLQAELADQAVTDAVTGLPNHRFFQQRLAEELERIARRAELEERRALSLSLFDLDHFKRVNDAFGHPSGDLVLRAVAEATSRALRGTDVVCRYGGEEFAIILVDTDGPAARLACDRVRRAIGRLELTAVDGRAIGTVTASFGLATVIDTSELPAALIERADQALYRAKAGGRDRVVHHDDAHAITP
jgi:two-component system, cell cycle response regulator